MKAILLLAALHTLIMYKSGKKATSKKSRDLAGQEMNNLQDKKAVTYKTPNGLNYYFASISATKNHSATGF